MARCNFTKTALMIYFFVAISLVAKTFAEGDLGVDGEDEGELRKEVNTDARRNELVDEVDVDVGDEEGEEHLTLSQLDPVKVGHEQEIEVSTDRKVHVKTVAVKPPVFEIFNLLTPDECDHVIKLGEEKGLHRSQTVTHDFEKKYGVYEADGVTPVYNVTEWQEKFNLYDADQNELIDHVELHGCFQVLNESKLTQEEVMKLIRDLDLDSNSDSVLNLPEFWSMMNRSLEDEVATWLGEQQAGEMKTDEETKGLDRISDQAWLWFVNSMDEVLSKLPYRIAALTGLHPDIIKSSESIQVARYYPGGYYHAHYDSMEIDQEKSCIQSMMTLRNVSHTHPKARMCRYITIMTYLNDVEEGGETAFPYADNETYSEEVATKQETIVTDLKNHCHHGNMVVYPQKGKTVMWYNHHIDQETGWLGDMDKYSLHGGCRVSRGVKWIANNWISVDDIYDQQIQFHKKYFKLYEQTGSETTQAEAPSNGTPADANADQHVSSAHDATEESTRLKEEL